jgi:WD40 repeat protein
MARPWSQRGEERDLRFWDVSTGKQTRRLAAGPLRNSAVAFSPDGRTLASLGDDGVLRLWQMPEAKEVRRFDGFAGGVVFAPDGKTLVAFAADTTIHLLDVGSGQEIRQMKNQGPRRIGFNTALVFSPDGKRLVAGSGINGKLIHIWDVATGDELPPLEASVGEVRALVFSPDGKVLVSAGDLDEPLRRWDLALRKDLSPPEGHRGKVTAVAFAGDSKEVSTGGVDRTFRRWETGTGRELARFQTNEPFRRFISALTPDGRLAATVGTDRRIVFWDVTTGKSVGELGQTFRAGVQSLALSPDGKSLAACDYSSPLQVWDVATGQVRATIGKSPVPLSVFSPPLFSPEGKVLAAVTGRDDEIVLWDATTGAELRRMTAPNGGFQTLAFSPDGRTLASAGSEAYLWEVATGKERCRLPGGWRVALSPDSRTLAVASYEGTIRIWDWLTGQEQVRFAGHRGRVECLAFDTDGRRLISGSWDNTALIWDVAAQLKRTARPEATLGHQDLAGLWADLADADAARAYRAQGRLAAAPRQAIPHLYAKLRPPASIAPLQMGRALEVLEQVGTAEARQALQDLARGTGGAPLTQHAQAALQRLAQRPLK